MNRALVVAALAAAALSACGFALRGQSQLPPAMDRTVLSGARAGSPLLAELGLLLRGHGIEVVRAGAGAARLYLGQDRLVRKVEAVGANARVREFALHYNVSFTLVDAARQALIPPQSVELRRDYTFDQTEILGAASEEEFLRAEMTRDMAREILARIELAAR